MISLVAAIANEIGMTLVYLWIIRVIKGDFAALKATPGGEVEIVDLLSDALRPFLRYIQQYHPSGQMCICRSDR